MMNVADNAGNKEVLVQSSADLKTLSYYTLCRLADFTHYADPIAGVPVAIARGEFKGVLTLDAYGNFVAFK